MKITDKMDLDELAVRMGGATVSQARHMRAALDGLGCYSDTEDVPERVWLALREASAAQARHDDDGGPYDRHKIALELDATALGRAYYGNSLRVAKDIPEETDEDRGDLDRYAAGIQCGTDHVALQDIAARIRAGADQDTHKRETMKASDIIRAMEHFIKHHGDRPVYFTDGFFRYGVTCHAGGAPNFDSPSCVLVKAFSLVTGSDGPSEPIALEHE